MVVHSYWVGLCTVGRAGAVKRNDLVAEDVLASLEGLRDGDGPSVVLADELDS